MKMKIITKAILATIIMLPQLSLAQTVTVTAPQELKAEDPTIGGYAFTRLGVAETLIRIDKAGNLAAQLATDWSVSDDKKVWTLSLRDDVKFSDGEPLTADAVVNALKVARTKPSPFKKVPVKSIENKNGKVVITLESPYVVLPATLAHYTTMILSPKVYNADGKVSKIVGTGPFNITNFKPPQRLDLAKKEDYWGKKASIDKVEYIAVSRGETRTLMAESTPSIIAYSLDPVSISRLKKNPDLTVMSIMLPRVITIKINNDHEFLKDVNVRKAMSKAIDRNAIASALMRTPEVKTTQIFPESLSGWHNKNLEPFTYDTQSAKALMEKAGFTLNDEGYAEKDGKVFEITMRTYSDRPELPLVANALQDLFKKIGIKMNVSIASYTEVPAGHKDGTLEVALITRNYTTVQSPLNNIAADFGKTGDKWGADWGSMNWKNEAVAQALNELKLDNTNEKADANRELVIKAIHEELPVIPVYWYKQAVVVSKNLKNVTLDPFDTTYRMNEIELTK